MKDDAAMMTPYEKFALDKCSCARANPKLAYLLEVVRPRLIPRTYRIDGTFDNVTVGQRLDDLHLRKPMCNDAVIWGMEYTIRSPALAGSPFALRYNFEQRLAPWVDIDLEFLGCGDCGPTDNLHITDYPIPLETAMHAAASDGCCDSILGDWRVIEKDFDIHPTLILQRVLNEDEIPYQVIIVFRMYELDRCCKMNSLDLKMVVGKLLDLGLLKADDAAVKAA